MFNKSIQDLLERQISRNIHLRAEDVLFRQGEPPISFYYVEKGKLRLERNTADGKLVILHEASAGQTIAEASLFSERYRCTAIAEVNSELKVFNKSQIISALKNDPKALMELLGTFANQVQELRDLNEIKNINSARDRILAFFALIVDEKGMIDMQPSIKNLAQKIGIAHETFYRVLNQLEYESIIKRKDKRVIFIKKTSGQFD